MILMALVSCRKTTKTEPKYNHYKTGINVEAR